MLSVFSFVLAAPIPREVRRACADVGENVVSASERRAPLARRNGPMYGSDSESDTEWWTPKSQSPSTGTPDASGHSGVGMPSSPSAGSESPVWSKVWSKTGGTEVPESAFKPTENQPASSSQAKKVSWVTTPESSSSSPDRETKIKWAPTTKVFMYDKDPLRPPPGREGYLAKEAAKTLPKPKSKGFMGNAKSYFGKFLSKLRIWRRF